MCVETKVEDMAPAPAAKGPAAASASEPRGTEVGVIVVVRHCYQGRIDCLRYVNRFSCRIFLICFMVMLIGRPFYLFFAVMRATAGAVYRSRVVRRGGGWRRWYSEGGFSSSPFVCRLRSR